MLIGLDRFKHGKGLTPSCAPSFDGSTAEPELTSDLGIRQPLICQQDNASTPDEALGSGGAPEELFEGLALFFGEFDRFRFGTRHEFESLIEVSVEASMGSKRCAH